jgi:hypothetical protein
MKLKNQDDAATVNDRREKLDALLQDIASQRTARQSLQFENSSRSTSRDEATHYHHLLKPEINVRNTEILEALFCCFYFLFAAKFLL